MAFEKNTWGTVVDARGSGVIGHYWHATDSLSDISASGYFNDNDVRAFIQAQEPAADAGVCVLIRSGASSGGGNSIVELKVDSAGNVTASAAAAADTIT